MAQRCENTKFNASVAEKINDSELFSKQKTAYEIPKRGWSSDVCSSDLPAGASTARGDTDRTRSGSSRLLRRLPASEALAKWRGVAIPRKGRCGRRKPRARGVKSD